LCVVVQPEGESVYTEADTLELIPVFGEINILGVSLPGMGCWIRFTYQLTPSMSKGFLKIVA
jgi:hypothetical protein